VVSVEAGDRRGPILGRELEHLGDGPVRPEAQKLLEVVLRIEPVKSARRDQRSEGRVPLEARLVGEEGPVVDPEDNIPELSLGDVVVQAEPAIGEEPAQGLALVVVVADRLVEPATGVDATSMEVDPSNIWSMGRVASARAAVRAGISIERQPRSTSKSLPMIASASIASSRSDSSARKK